METYKDIVNAGENVKSRMAAAYCAALSGNIGEVVDGDRVAKKHVDDMPLDLLWEWDHLLREYKDLNVYYEPAEDRFYISTKPV